jgi:hypothetical protein
MRILLLTFARWCKYHQADRYNFVVTMQQSYRTVYHHHKCHHTHQERSSAVSSGDAPGNQPMVAGVCRRWTVGTCSKNLFLSSPVNIFLFVPATAARHTGDAICAVRRALLPLNKYANYQPTKHFKGVTWRHRNNTSGNWSICSDGHLAAKRDNNTRLAGPTHLYVSLGRQTLKLLLDQTCQESSSSLLNPFHA